MNMKLSSGIHVVTLPEPEKQEEDLLKLNTTRKLSMQGVRRYLATPKVDELRYEFVVPSCSPLYPTMSDFIQFLLDTKGAAYKIWNDVPSPPYVYDVHIVNSPIDIDILPSWYKFQLQLQRIYP
jgi:hypothetical protein